MYDEAETQAIINDYNEALEKIIQLEAVLLEKEAEINAHELLEITNANFDNLDFSSFECMMCNKKLAGQGSLSQLVIELTAKGQPYSYQARHTYCLSRWLEGGKV